MRVACIKENTWEVVDLDARYSVERLPATGRLVVRNAKGRAISTSSPTGLRILDAIVTSQINAKHLGGPDAD